ncbi:hypothetical protein [Parachlamydia acanthamoebae]|uniref:Uncharacterized protein n=4 Tax=Parachlamydia TaxID=83551 RepID=F8KYR5_PARAV|nr:hypothetical protein [Parachlamydia acanthamoebae]KIA78240.1 hypothetical protein DB43_EJ00110 [Parachlamydia acanthamoebae]CCB86020.1 putative uncharacterized protein [Parachlamydia acanthamoebae UV-7]
MLYTKRMISILLIFLSTACFASTQTTKVYLSADQIVFIDTHLFVMEEGRLHFVNIIEQDEHGFFYHKQAFYGFCPNGHPYGPDGSCLGSGCPFN